MCMCLAGGKRALDGRWGEGGRGNLRGEGRECWYITPSHTGVWGNIVGAPRVRATTSVMSAHENLMQMCLRLHTIQGTAGGGGRGGKIQRMRGKGSI